MFVGDVEPGDTHSWTNALKQGVFWGVHLVALGALFVGFSWIALAVCALLFFVRMFAITGAYHRYFSHRTYRTSRWFQAVLAFVGASSGQKGPIWWASHHRHHHRHSDTPEDAHSPIVKGIYYAHVGWVLSTKYLEPRLELVPDLVRFPELRLLERYYWVPPALLGVATFCLGVLLQSYAPQLGTNGWQMLIWGFFVSTVILYHATFCINSFTHLWGRKRFKTGDSSRNSLLFALITLGEGWHNNHHRYPGSEPQGMYWWEIDISHYVLLLFSKLGLVYDLRRYPERIYAEAKAGFVESASTSGTDSLLTADVAGEMPGSPSASASAQHKSA